MDAASGPDANYVPGDWVAVAGRGCWLLIDLPPAHPIVNQCWQLVSDAASADDLLDVLVSGGIRSAPSFALARSSTDERRALVRGTASLTVRGAAHDDVELAAFTGATWADEPIGDWAETLVLSSNQPSDATVDLPMSAGVTMASSIQVRVHEAARTTKLAPQPAPSIVPGPTTQKSMPAQPDEVVPEMPSPKPTPIEEAAAPSYDYLFGATQRPPAPEQVVEPGQSVGELPTQVENPAASGTDDSSPSRPASTDTAGWSTLSPLAAPGALIDVVPWLDNSQPHEPPNHAEPAAQQQNAPVDARPESEEPPTEVVETVNRSSLLASAGAMEAGPTVLAAYCPTGHLSPAHAPLCRVCGAAVAAQQGFEIARPVLGVLRMSNGEVVRLDRGVILGRAPELPSGDERDRPNVLRLISPENDISRNHAEVVLDGWHVYVRDLGSTNGTVITLPGQQPTRLREDDMHPIEPGTTVSLADEVTFTYEVTG
jgi:FHA domain-containing protein